jgi:hypothetical protein
LLALGINPYQRFILVGHIQLFIYWLDPTVAIFINFFVYYNIDQIQLGGYRSSDIFFLCSSG